MTSNNEYKILLKLRRDYSKDEAFSYISDKLKNAEFKNGELQSEIAELKFQLNLLSKIKAKRQHPVPSGLPPHASQTKKQWRKDELIAEYERVAQIKHRKLSEAEKSLIEYRNKYYSLLQKLSKP